MSYIDELAEEIRQEVREEDLSEADGAALFRVYAVLALAKGERAVLEDVHDAWAAWTAGRDPGHRSLRPFGELTDEVREYDRPYLDAIHAVARRRGLGR